MIVVDTSALLAIVGREEYRDACARALERAPKIAISAGTLVEVFVVSRFRNLGEQMIEFVEYLDFEVVPVTEATARIAGEAYRVWGKGMHAARLNFGDCFSYALAKERDWPLLFIGDDFSKTDIRSVLPR